MKREHSGSTLLIIMVVLVTLTAAVLGALNLTSGVARNVQRSNQLRNAREIGDGVLEYAFGVWRERSRPTPNVHLTTSDLAAVPVPASTLFPDVENFSVERASNPSPPPDTVVTNYKIEAVNPEWIPMDPTVAPTPAYGRNLATKSYYYMASATVTLPTLADKLTVNSHRIFEKRFDSPWNYAIFYTDRLEIHPGPDFNVTGWVHTNENLYTGHNTLNFESKVTFGNSWEVNFAPGDSRRGTETPTSPHWNSNLPPIRGQEQDPFGIEPSILNTSDSNPNNDSYRELLEKPVAGFTDPFASSRYYNQADVKLIVNNDGSGNPVLSIYDNAGTLLSASSTGTGKALYDVYTSAVTLGQTIQDNRENKSVRLISVDMSKVYTAMNSGGTLAGKGLKGVVYVTDNTASSSLRRAVRLKNGAKMPPGGLTVATDLGLYLQGDYNTGTTGATQPNSNASGGDPTKNTVTGYERQPSAVLADAVMVLSNSWVDANSTAAVGSRVASPTTINAAIVSGIVPTDGTNSYPYSGGAENFPRFLETWGSGRTFTYYGSMVELFHSKHFTGRWGKSNVYDPPRRKWYFDRKFYTSPPPGSLQLVSYAKLRWYQE